MRTGSTSAGPVRFPAILMVGQHDAMGVDRSFGLARGTRGIHEHDRGFRIHDLGAFIGRILRARPGHVAGAHPFIILAAALKDDDRMHARHG